ncbi:MAG: CHAP domain-containing protein [Acetobacteraceae bacterium]|nr:CHAP domain-containing protein [Acetobacteraceae bacterium]
MILRSALFRSMLPSLTLAVLLAGCGSRTSGVASGSSMRVPGISCAPFARELSGIALYGEADTWWRSAGGQYTRSHRPVLGSVLVLRRTSRLRSGHVMVVTRLVGARQIQVTQANWVPGSVDEDQLVVDVSADNDWSEVRVWYPPVGQLGKTVYPAHGFIHPRRAATYAELTRATPIAARYALDTAGRRPPRARIDG